MVRVRKTDVLIRVKCGEDYGHAFINGLQRDLIELMNGLHVMHRSHELDYPFRSYFQDLKLLQEALILSELENEEVYQVEITDEQKKAGDEKWHQD